MREDILRTHSSAVNILSSSSNAKSMLTSSWSAVYFFPLLALAIQRTIYFAATVLLYLRSITSYCCLIHRCVYLLTQLQHKFNQSRRCEDQTTRRTLIRTVQRSPSHNNVSSFQHYIYHSITHSLNQLRKKVFFEFMCFILGTGNGLFLLLFWPGWLILGGAIWSILWLFA